MTVRSDPLAAPMTLHERPWLARYDYWVPPHIHYPRQPVQRLLEVAVSRFGAQTATIFFGARLTYRDIKLQAEGLATGLAELGVVKGDRVGIMLPNCPQYLAAFYGILMAGGVVVNVNPTFTEREIEFVATDSGFKVIIALDTLAPRLLAVKDRTAIETIILTGVQDRQPPAIAQSYEAALRAQGRLPDLPDLPGLRRFDDVLAAASAAPPTVVIDAEEDVAVLQYTGGTTGRPKGAMLTHANIVANVIQAYVWGREYARPGEDVWLMILPFFHIYGMTVGIALATYHGAQVVLLPQFDVDMALLAIQEYKVNIFPGVPTLFIALLNHPNAATVDWSFLRQCNSGSAPLPVEVLERFQRLANLTIIEGYGLTEASPTTHVNPTLNTRKPGSIGLPYPDTDCQIVDVETGLRSLPPGELGELIIRGPQIMKGYWNRPDETALTLRGGWLYSGDIARMDEQGYFYIVDRKKDMILVSGFNVYPREVEEILYTHPAILECAVIGIPDSYQGESVKAFVVLRESESLTADDIIDYCRTQLAAYKCPRTVEFRDSLPKSAVGKVLRTALRQQGQ